MCVVVAKFNQNAQMAWWGVEMKSKYLPIQLIGWQKKMILTMEAQSITDSKKEQLNGLSFLDSEGRESKSMAGTEVKWSWQADRQTHTLGQTPSRASHSWARNALAAVTSGITFGDLVIDVTGATTAEGEGTGESKLTESWIVPQAPPPADTPWGRREREKVKSRKWKDKHTHKTAHWQILR